MSTPTLTVMDASSFDKLNAKHQAGELKFQVFWRIHKNTKPKQANRIGNCITSIHRNKKFLRVVMLEDNKLDIMQTSLKIGWQFFNS